jgi:hypothetical protein
MGVAYFKVVSRNSSKRSQESHTIRKIFGAKGENIEN